VSCDAAIEPVVNYFSPAEGGVVCPRCAEASPGIQSIAVNSLKVLRYWQTHPFDACERLQLGAEIQRDMENLMLRYMTCYIERNLKSVEFLRLLRQSDKSLRPDAVATVAPAEGEPTPT
jgi:DNA repair protein RecO (recombination protein O)